MNVETLCSDTHQAVGVDVGGTNLRAALIGLDGKITSPIYERVRTERQAFSSRIGEIVETLDPTGSLSVGIGLPGRVDLRANLPITAGYIDIAGLPIPELLGSSRGRIVRLDNDASMALRAEMAVGVARDVSNVVMLTIGTGIGGAYALNGAIIQGHAFAGQFGHITVQALGGELCNCGRRGCVETTSSGSALGRLMRAAGVPAESRASDLVKRAAEGDETSLSILATWATPLRCAMESITAALDPDLIVLGGGLGPDALAALDYAPCQSDWFRSPLLAGSLGDDAGMIGAGLYALEGQRLCLERLVG
jgi:glucokinase